MPENPITPLNQLEHTQGRPAIGLDPVPRVYPDLGLGHRIRAQLLAIFNPDLAPQGTQRFA
jgi:hypothetical protein